MSVKQIFLSLLTGLTVLAAGCQMIDDAQYEPSYVLSFYSRIKYPGQTEMIEREIVDTFSTKSYWVNGNQFFDSRNIEQIEMEPVPEEPGKYRLLFKLNRSGVNRWTALCGHNASGEVILLIDSQFYCAYVQTLTPIPDKQKENWVRCDAKFDELTATGAKNFAEQNYRHFNPDINRLF